MNHLKKIFWPAFLLLVSLQLHAQKQKANTVVINGIQALPADSSLKIRINRMEVTGNKRTKVYIVQREIHFKTGDSLPISTLAKELEQARRQVYNTSLFNEVNFILTILDSVNADLHVQLTERWYLYPVPQFQLVDRNLNEWWDTYHHSLSRVNYGIKFVHYNLSGRKDQLRIYFINGYSRNISFSYTAPYSNRALTEGFTIGAGFTQKREVAYGTTYRDSLLFYPADSATRAKADFVFKNWYAQASYIIRRGLFTRHIFAIGYTYQKVDDSVAHKNYNPNYFKDGKSEKGFFELSYLFQYTNVNNVSYPLTGRSAFMTIQKRGLGFTGGVNMLNIEAGYNWYHGLGKNWYAGVYLNGKIKLPLDQAYINQRGLGYGENYLRGLEYYVVDGVASALVKTTIRKKVIAFNVPFRLFPRLFTKIPFTIFAKTYGDVGYVYNKKSYDTYLNNRILYTGGFGIDIVTIYDFSLRLEYSFNQLGKNGLFLHSQSGF